MKDKVNFLLICLILTLISFGELPKIYGMRFGYILLPLVVILNFNLFFDSTKQDIKKYKAFLIFGIYLILQNVLNYRDQRSIGFTVWYFFNFMLIYFVIKARIKALDFSAIIVGGLGALHIIYQYLFSFDPDLLRFIDYSGRLRFASYFGEPSYAVLYLGLCLIIITYNNVISNKLKRGLFLILTIAVALTGSKLYWILIFFLFFINWRVGLLQLSFILVFMIVPPRSEKFLNEIKKTQSLELLNEIQTKTTVNYDMSLREASFRRGIKAFFQSPFIGVGVGNSKHFIEQNKILPNLNTGYTYEGVHNLFLEISVELGVAGLILFTWLLLDILNYKLFNYSNAVFIATLAMMQFCQNFNMPAMWMAFIFTYFKRETDV